METKHKTRWTYGRSESDPDGAYVIRAGDKVLARVDSRSVADMICYGRTESLRQHGDFRRYHMEVQRLKSEIKFLLEGLRMVSDALKLRKPREVLKAREEANRILKRMKSAGYQ